MNTKQFRSLVLEVLRAGDALQTAAIALQKLAVAMPYAEFNDAAAKIIGEKYGVEPHESRKGGTLTFTKDSAEEQRLKRIRRLHPDMAGDASNKRAPAPVRARVIKPLAASMIASIIDAGLTKAELAALLEAVKAGVSFE